jgi:hypothetical protein
MADQNAGDVGDEVACGHRIASAVGSGVGSGVGSNRSRNHSESL